ncbi:MAG: hypothetical protein AAF647_09590 [Pseudomonadota bacterium]
MRLITLERRKLYEYNCDTGREGTFGRVGAGQFEVKSEINVIGMGESSNVIGLGREFYPDGQKSEKARAKFHDSLGLTPAAGEKGAHDAFRKAAAGFLGQRTFTLPVNIQAIKDRHKPAESFTIYAIVECVHLRLKVKPSSKNVFVILSVPRKLHFYVSVYKRCHGEDAELFIDNAEYVDKSRPAKLTYPAGNNGRSVIEEHDKRAKKRRKEEKRKKARDAVEKAAADAKGEERLIEHLKEEIEKAKKRKKKAEEREKEARRAAEEAGRSGGR